MMLVTKDTDLLPTLEGVEINSYGEAVTVYTKGNALAKIADAIRGSALDWVKTNEPERYDEFLKVMQIKPRRADILIAHSKLVKLAKELGEVAPTKATSTAKLPGKKPAEKLDHYHKIQEETGKQEPNQRDIENYKKKLSEKNYNSQIIKNSYNSKSETNLKDDTDSKPTIEELQEEIVKLKAELKREKALKKKYYEELQSMAKWEKYYGAYAASLISFESILKFREEDEAKRLLNYANAQEIEWLKEAEEAMHILKLDASATFEDAKNRWKELSKKHHPDKGYSDKMQKSLNRAYDRLKRLKKKGLIS